MTAMSPCDRRFTSSLVRLPRRARPRCTTSRADSTRTSGARRAARGRPRPLRCGAAITAGPSLRLSVGLEVIHVRERTRALAPGLEQKAEVVRAARERQSVLERDLAGLHELQQRLIE